MTGRRKCPATRNISLLAVYCTPNTYISFPGVLLGTSSILDRLFRQSHFDSPTYGSSIGPSIVLLQDVRQSPNTFIGHILINSRYETSPLSTRRTVHAVNDMNMEAYAGQILCLLGPNGSGKSTTLKCIAGQENITSRTVTIDATGGLGYAPQSNVLW